MREESYHLKGLFLGIVLTVVCYCPSVAQVGNEWINFNQPYFKIPVAKDGVYRLSASDLQAAGVPSSIDPTRLQLFHRGKEQAITVFGQNDGQLNAGDYIEFYGLRNDGTVDAELYKPQTAQPHPYYNLYSDTTTYFLTVGASPGKRMAVFDEPNSTSVAAEIYHFDENIKINTDQYSAGLDLTEVLNTFFDYGEGWTGYQIVQGEAVDYVLTNVDNGEATGGLPQIELVLVGRGPMIHQFEIYAGAGQRLVGTFGFSGFESFKITQPIQWADIGGDGQLPITVKCIGVGGAPDRVSVSYVKVRYPQKLSMASATEKVFMLPAHAPGPSYVEIQNPATGALFYDVTDLDNPIRIGTTTTTTLNAMVQAPTERKLFATNSFLSTSIKPVSFRQIFPSAHDYIIISNPLLRTPSAGYNDPVAAYGAYRASVDGGGYDTLIVNVQQLFDQFAYGEQTPVAIYRFMKFLTNVKTPKYLLLIGKGINVDYQYYRSPSSFSTYKDFVPSAGYPGSDMAYTVGLAGTSYEPAVATGRITALKSEDVANYLNKVKEMEALPFNALWRKDLVHLSGGIYEGEPQLFKSYMQELQVVAEKQYLGARVSAFAKHSKEIQVINIAEQVNKGLNMVTFFGHASPTLLDFELGYVTDPIQGYNNKGKYPTLLMNGCEVGAIFLTYTVFGENWLVAKDKGAIGFIAHSAFGFTGSLKKYADTFYDVGYTDSSYIHRGLGDIQKETARRYMQSSTVSPANTTQVQQMILLGDPAVKLFGARKADLEISENHVSFQSFNGGPILASTDSFAISMIVRNFGQAPPDTVRISIQRTLDDNTVLTYDSLYPATKYSDTLMFTVRKGKQQSFGNNVFKITIDPDNIISEYSKDNNTVSKTLFISSNGTRNLYPSNYAIVNKRDVTLSLQATDLLSGERDFLVELDTAYNFDSPFKKQWTVKGKLLARQIISLLESDTLAYYWRTKLAQPKPGELAEWTQSSFTYIPNGPEGWAQVNFNQYLQNESVGFTKDAGLRKLKFSESVQPVSVTTLGSQYPNYYDSISVKISNVEYFEPFPGFGCRPGTLNLVAFDRKSTVPYIGVKLEFFNRAGRTCGRVPFVINDYQYYEMVSDSLTDLLGYVNNIEAGDSVMLFNVGATSYSLWPPAAKAKLGEFGISLAQLSTLEDDEPFVIFGRKGDAPGSAIIYRSTDTPRNQQRIKIDKTITGGYSDGKMGSGWIGPAMRWDSLYVSSSEREFTDSVKFKIVGVQQNGAEETLFTDVEIDVDLKGIDAKKYPYLKIAFNTQDETYLTTAQLRHWIVDYVPGPEGILIYDGPTDQEQVTEGVAWKTEYGFLNISDKIFRDSLIVRYEVFNQTKLGSEINSVTVAPPMPGDTTKIRLEISTLGKGGLNDFDVFVNPRIQPEQYYDNNVLQLAARLNVAVDALHPVMDVAFDGRHLIDKDFVSPSPQIVTKIWDENKSILKTDTAGVRLFLTYPCEAEQCAPTRILLSDPMVKWSAATDTSDFNFLFTPRNLADGTYKLRVEGADARGNASGVDPYEIEFVVKNETTIMVSDPHPNPFNREVYFQIVLSGGSLPDQFDLQFINVNGQLEDRFTADDFPVLHIGTNEIAWDGSSANGNTLPNGIYIYRMNLTIGDSHIQRIGKLVLLR